MDLNKLSGVDIVIKQNKSLLLVLNQESFVSQICRFAALIHSQSVHFEPFNKPEHSGGLLDAVMF